MNAEPPALPTQQSPARAAVEPTLSAADLVQLSYQVAALGGAGLQLLFSRGPMSGRRVAETLLLWQMIMDLGHTVMNSKFSVQRDGLKFSLVSGIGDAGLLGLWANSLVRRGRKGRSRRGAGPLDLDVAGLGLSQDTLGVIARWSGRVLENIAGAGAEFASIGGMVLGPLIEPPAARGNAQSQRIAEAPPSAMQALTPAIQAGLLALYTLSKRNPRSRSHAAFVRR
jgi:hypothetical protein